MTVDGVRQVHNDIAYAYNDLKVFRESNSAYRGYIEEFKSPVVVGDTNPYTRA